MASRFLHSILLTAMLCFGIGEAVELPSFAHSVAGEVQSHEHHAGVGSQHADNQHEEGDEHCSQCCHAPCAWVSPAVSAAKMRAPAAVEKRDVSDAFLSRTGPPLLRPPIS